MSKLASSAGASNFESMTVYDFPVGPYPPLSGLMSRPLLHSLKHSGAFGDLYASLFR